MAGLPRVLIADAQPLFAEALGRALAVDHQIDVVPESPERVASAIDALRRHRPDVVVYDFWLLGMDGAAAVRRIRSSWPETRVLVTSWCHGTAHIQAALSAGASGFLPKSLRVAQVAEAVNKAVAGENLVFAEQLAGLVDGIEARWQGSIEGRQRLASLTRREMQVLQVLSEGATLTGAAEQLSISPGTLKNHVHHILAKTATVSHVEAVSMAREAGLLDETRRREPPGAGSAAPTPAAAVASVRGRSKPTERTSVLVADTQLLFADALATALSGSPGLVVMPTLPTRAGEAIDAVVRLRPAVVVYDLYLRDMECVAAVRALSRWVPDTRVVLASWYHGRPRVRQALAVGLRVMVPKSASLATVAETVRNAGRSDAGVHGQQLAAVLDLLDERRVPQGELERLLTLTPREVQLLQLSVRGRPVKEVADQLCLAVGTVKNINHRIMGKLGVRTQLEALTMARQAGFLWEDGAPGL